MRKFNVYDVVNDSSMIVEADWVEIYAHAVILHLTKEDIRETVFIADQSNVVITDISAIVQK